MSRFAKTGTGDDSARTDTRCNRNEWLGVVVQFNPLLDVIEGFTGGNNVIIRSALQSADPPQYVMLLNADAGTIVRPGALKALVDFTGRKSARWNRWKSPRGPRWNATTVSISDFPPPLGEVQNLA